MSVEETQDRLSLNRFPDAHTRIEGLRCFPAQARGITETLAGGRMEKDNTVSEADVSTSPMAEDTMEPSDRTHSVQPLSHPVQTSPCVHRRAIDDVLTRSRKRTGKVRCLECGAVFDDPYQGSK